MIHHGFIFEFNHKMNAYFIYQIYHGRRRVIAAIRDSEQEARALYDLVTNGRYHSDRDQLLDNTTSGKPH